LGIPCTKSIFYRFGRRVYGEEKRQHGKAHRGGYPDNDTAFLHVPYSDAETAYIP